MTSWEKMKTNYDSREKAKAAALRKKAEKGIAKVQIRARKGYWVVKYIKGEKAEVVAEVPEAVE